MTFLQEIITNCEKAGCLKWQPSLRSLARQTPAKHCQCLRRVSSLSHPSKVDKLKVSSLKLKALQHPFTGFQLKRKLRYLVLSDKGESHYSP
ncbi:hypothetical protein POTOM_041674 [Populus tomentosa]|uniref:Uncharacterized protein n=1 Tax=Populus tomentosa TaxID=118781 RepID=A0A8X7YR12_POPTO|nr:hypothetical protein POTOM_041674 [Populus tomentosa]